MNVIKHIRNISLIHNAVSREDGTLEIYYFNNLKKIQYLVLNFINNNCLNDCFLKIDFIKLEEGVFE